MRLKEGSYDKSHKSVPIEPECQLLLDQLFSSPYCCGSIKPVGAILRLRNNFANLCRNGLVRTQVMVR